MNAQVINFEAHRAARRPSGLGAAVDMVDEAMMGQMIWGRSAPVLLTGTRQESVDAVTHLIRTSPCPAMIISWDGQARWEDELVAAWAGLSLSEADGGQLDLGQWQRLAAARRSVTNRQVTFLDGHTFIGPQVLDWLDELGPEVAAVVLDQAPTAVRDSMCEALQSTRAVTVSI